MARKKRICIITCYKDPDYIRARTLRVALRGVPGYEIVVIKNSYKGILRYFEVAWQTLFARFRHNPDVYLLTFRGYEMLPIIRLTTIGKPLVYDEFINPIEWVVYEHKKIKAGSLAENITTAVYRILLNSAQLILTDTASHADYSSKLMRIDRKKFLAVPVGTDEVTFAPRKALKEKAKKSKFVVFYYGNMLPLHGLPVVIEAAKRLKASGVTFRIVGGKKDMQELVKEAIAEGTPIDYSAWLPFEQLPVEAAKADVCLGGPFGGTLQADMVITGKAYQFLCMGRPTIIGSNQENSIFTHKENAIIVEQRSADALSEAIEWALDNRAKLENIGLEGRKLFLRRFATSAIADKLVGELKKL